MKLSLILPVFNESHRLKAGLITAIDYLSHQPYTWEIVLVDDGSTDNSAPQLDHPNVYLLRTAHNFGKGHAIRLGVAASKGDYIIFSDIDFSVPPEFISPLINALKSSDITVASRRLLASRITQHQNRLRELLGQCFTLISNFILGLHHTDLTCGLKGFRAKVARDLFFRQKLNRWAFDPEILFLAQKLHYHVAEIPVQWQNDPRSKVNLLTDIYQSLFSLPLIRLVHL